MKERFFGKCSDLDLTALFIPTLEGARDLALPPSECVKVETYVMQPWKVSCDDSWLENKAVAVWFSPCGQLSCLQGRNTFAFCCLQWTHLKSLLGF